MSVAKIVRPANYFMKQDGRFGGFDISLYELKGTVAPGKENLKCTKFCHKMHICSLTGVQIYHD